MFSKVDALEEKKLAIVALNSYIIVVNLIGGISRFFKPDICSLADET